MSQIEQIVDELNRAFDGEAWHGPALMEILDGVDAKTAAARFLPNAHSIWELALHLAAWEHVVARRIDGETVTLTDEENFGRVKNVSESAWQETVKNLREKHAALIKKVSTLPDSALTRKVPGKNYSLQFMLSGAVQHAAYHGGQISLLKRAKS